MPFNVVVYNLVADEMIAKVVLLVIEEEIRVLWLLQLLDCVEPGALNTESHVT